MANTQVARLHPQWTAIHTVIEPSSFFGKIRTIYADNVLKAQLEQLKSSGCYDVFTGKWLPCYETRRTFGGKASGDGLPPSLFWESDIGKWIEAVSYFLANPASAESLYTHEFVHAIDKLVNEIEAFQHDDGYLNVYFSVVDPTGKFRNLRDMHEMYNAGHLLEAAIAHYRWIGSPKFLNVMIKNIECFMRAFGNDETKLHGYDGHPELELAVLRLHAVTGNTRYLEFAHYLLTARGTSSTGLDGKRFFIWEAEQRDDQFYGCWMRSKDDLVYHQAHKPICEQNRIVGHSVRALYLITACADIGGTLLDDAKRLWANATQRKMYITGGIGSVPISEGFSDVDYFIPFSTGSGGCVAETCASIALMMVSERLLSHELNRRYRDVLELCLYNAVLGGGSLDGKSFNYENKLATYGNESASRSKWFAVACCPPNVSRTFGILPGYIWSFIELEELIEINVYLYASAERTITLTPGNGKVTVKMKSEMPWSGLVSIDITAPAQIKVKLRLFVAEWMIWPKFSMNTQPYTPGYVEAVLTSDHPKLSLSFELETRLVYPNARVGQDTLSVMRGPIVFVAEDIDNTQLEISHPHFALVGLSESATFKIIPDTIADIPIIKLETDDVYLLQHPGCSRPTDQSRDDASFGSNINTSSSPLWNSVRPGLPVREWTKAPMPLTFIPWFARGNRGGKGHLRVPFMRVGADLISTN